MPDPVVSSTDPELRAHVERVLTATYELDREIGRGGMGIVYKARDRRLKRPVAIKVLPPELAFRSEIRTRFLREAETAAQLSHPNIVPIYSVDERDGIVYFVMAFVDGENLAVRLHQHGAMPPEEARRVLLEVARALAYAHERGVIHRDIKPDNILIQRDGRVMVTDFGIARAVSEGADARLTATGMAIGTPAYMSPEQSMGEREVDGRSDLYSLGVVGYQLLTGDLPFEAQSTPALLVKHLSERPTPIDERRRGVPDDLNRAVMLCLEKDPDNRFPSAGALATALESGNVPALPEAPPPAAQPLQRLASRPTPRDGVAVPTSEELSRWREPKVVAFRRKLAPWIVVGAVSIVLDLFTGVDFTWFWGIWTVVLAFQYARLWQDGYDWHDVFKQPQDRLFFDVVAEWVDNVRAMWDPEKRAVVRERARARSHAGSLFDRDDAAAAALPPARGGAAGRSSGAAARRERLTNAGPYAATVREARRERDEVLRLYEGLSASDKKVATDVPAAASRLYDHVERLAASVAELERNLAPDASEKLEAEIASLEAQANPFDVRASEERVRRLAYLKKQRQAIKDLVSRRERNRERLESCVLALQNMRYDVMRLGTGSASLQNVTQVAEQALALAKEVDNAMYVAEEMRKLGAGTGSRPGGRR